MASSATAKERRPAAVEGNASDELRQPSRSQPRAEGHEEEQCPTLVFHLNEDKKRSTIAPSDVASLALWGLLPLEHPLCVDAPRWCYLAHKRRVSSCLVVHVDGLTHEAVTRSVFGSPDATGADVAGDALASTAGGADRTNLWLRLFRDGGDGALGKKQLGNVPIQYAPLWMRNTMGRLDTEFFFRNDRRRRLAALHRPGQAPAQTPVRECAPPAKKPTLGPLLAFARKVLADKAVSADEKTDEPCGEEAAAAPPLSSSPIPEAAQKHWENIETTTLESNCMAGSDLVAHGFLLYERDFAPLLSPEAAENLEVPSVATHFQPERAVAIDCEMVRGVDTASLLARVSVVRVPTGEVLFDSVVIPDGEIVDYLTRYSGITAQMINDATLTFADAQRAVRRLVTTETFVVGHALENDFAALKLTPATEKPRVLDTAHLFPHPNGLPAKNALRYLVKQYLQGRVIQGGSGGHDSVEDAAVCIELIGLKLANGPDFGMPSRVNIAEVLCAPLTPEDAAAIPSPNDESEGGTVVWRPPVVTIVERNEVLRRAASKSTSAVQSRDDADATKKACAALRKAAAEEADSRRGALVFVRLRETCVDEAEDAPDGDEVVVQGTEPTTAKNTDDASPTTVATPAVDAQQQLERKACALNARLGILINAAPLHTLILCMSAYPPVDDAPNRHSSAHGAVYGFVKNTDTRLSEEPATYAPRPRRKEADGSCAQS